MSEKAQGISAFAISPNRRFLAVAERGEKPVIIVYDITTLRKRKILNLSDVESKEIPFYTRKSCPCVSQPMASF